MVMDPVTRAILASWNWRPEVILSLLLVGVLYGVGWWRLRRKRRRDRGVANGWRLTAYLAGLLLIALALLSPIETLAGQFFFMHMIQHLLLIMLAPPLLMLANPLPFVLWGLPAGVRHATGRGLSQVLHRESAFRRTLRTVTGPGIVWMVYVSLLVGWHDPNAYNLALTNQWVHDLEHFSFFLPSLAYWWLVIGAGPRIHKQMSTPARMAFVIAAIPPTMLLGVSIAFATAPIYTYYLGVPRPWGLSVLQDQMLGGVIMWVPGSMMYIIATLILAAGWLQTEDRKPPLPIDQWSTKETMAAPGVHVKGKSR